MSEEVRTRTFKSGNSIALRLPKSLGLVEGDEIRIVPHADGSYSFWKIADDKDRFMALYGSLSSGFMAEGRGDIDQEDRNWSPGDPTSKAA